MDHVLLHWSYFKTGICKFLTVLDKQHNKFGLVSFQYANKCLKLRIYTGYIPDNLIKQQRALTSQ